MAIVDVYEIQARVRDEASSSLREVQASIRDAADASAYLTGLLGQTSEELGKGKDGATQYSAQVRALAETWKVSAEQLDKLNSQVRENPYDEAGQKLLDARKRLDEYGASVEEQAQALALLARSATTSTLPLSKQALVLEELAIEFQDAKKALAFFEEGLKLVEQRGGRAEDAIADLTAAAKGDTGGLNRLGPVARAAAEGLDQIRDPALRAERTLATFRREAARVPDALDRANDQIALAKVRLAELSARLGPVGQIAGVAAAGLLALGGGALALATDATLSYVESNRGAKESLEQTKGAVSRLEREFGRLVAQAIDLDKVLLGVGGSARQLTDVLIAVDRETSGWGETLGYLEQASDLLGGRVTALGSVFGQVGGVVGDLGVGLGSLAFDAIAAQEERTRKASETLREEISRQGDEWERLNAFLLEGDDYTRQLQRSQEELTRTLRIGQVDDATALRLASQGRALDTPRQGPLLPTGKFDAQIEAPRPQQRRSGPSRQEELEREEARIARLGQILEDAQRQELERRARERIAEWGRIGTGYANELVFGFGEALREEGGALIGALDEALGGDEVPAQIRDLRRELELTQEQFSDLVEGGFERSLDLSNPADVAKLEDLLTASQQLNEGLNQLATQGLASVTSGLLDIAAAAATGRASVGDLGKAFLGQLGPVLERAGEGMFLLGLGTLEIFSGIANPAALIAIGAGLKIAGAGISAFANSRGGGGRSTAATTASATRDAFRESTDRLLSDQKRERDALYVQVYVGGEQLDAQVEQSARRLRRNGLLGQGV